MVPVIESCESTYGDRWQLLKIAAAIIAGLYATN